ncbi:hypothetical protein QYM36_002094 [Artemia franciscana]|uniref:Uncharacterized protein n=1 Tax=Artemia franciscana TaxID=6661 RepID=A0AA88I8Y0_ARTSF|nr:hypothetical protein QYM36_002094 [Artemia franciscana]
MTSRPISDKDLLKFANWISQVSWDKNYKAEVTHSKASQKLPEIVDYSSFAKLRPDDHPLEEKGDVVMITRIIKLKPD